MKRKMIFMGLLITIAMLMAGCVPALPATTNGNASESTTPTGNESPPTVSATDALNIDNIIPSIVADAPDTTQTEWIELAVPSEEFMKIRDEILIEVLGIDGNLPIYHSYEDNPDYVELPYGGVLKKLGAYTYRTGLFELELGFDIIAPSTFRYYYTDLGLEVDIVSAGDAPYNVIRYLYISNESPVMLPSGIRIGSLREDVVKEYEQYIIPGFRPMLTSEEVIALGSELNGIYFVIRDDHVYSIYVAVISEDSKFSGWISLKLPGLNMYPDWFYPDREYMETALLDES